MRVQLAELDSARKRFIATASHELRTPIFSLGGFLELLADEDLDDETRRSFVQEIREQVDRLGKLATDLLDLSRLEAGSLELRARAAPTSRTICRMVAGEFAPAAAQRESELDARLPREPLEATCDPERLAQIMRILIDNALRHTPDRHRRRGVGRTRDGTRVAARGRSTAGPASSARELDRVFEPFYTSDDARGSGLGLAIARELAERMNGRLAARQRARAHDVLAGAAGVRRRGACLLALVAARRLRRRRPATPRPSCARRRSRSSRPAPTRPPPTAASTWRGSTSASRRASSR